jgi:hypothetical protein
MENVKIIVSSRYRIWGVDWFDLASVGIGCRAVVSAGMRLRVLKIVGEFLAS